MFKCKHRDRFTIIDDILGALQEGHLKKTGIMYRANLKHDQLNDYMSLLEREELVERNESGGFEVTEKGHEYRKQYCAMKKLVPELNL